MSQALDAYARAAAAVERLIGQVEDWGRPTPCTDWDVRTLVNHMTTGELVFAAIMRGDPPPDQAAGHLGTDPVAGFRSAAGQFSAAASAPGVAQRKFPTPFGEQPAGMIVMLRTAELLVHGWDLARALGASPDALPADLAEDAVGQWRERLAAMPRAEGGPLGVEQPAPAGAPAPDRLAALFGRRLDWSPA